MPFCPICKSEYIEGVVRCKDCNAELVPELPGDEDHPRYKFVSIREGINRFEATAIKDELEAHGIPAILVGDEVSSIHYYPAHDARVKVPQRFYDQAKEIIEALSLPADTVICDNCNALVSSDAKVCPNCGEPFEGEAEDEEE